MRGEIISHDGATGTGLISGDDGLRYEFTDADIQSGTAAVGLRVDFVADAGRAAQIMVLAAAPQTAMASSDAPVNPDVIDWQHLMLRFDGRIRRTHFGIAWLILFAIYIVTSFIPLVGWIVSLALLWPGLAITVKRLHDIGLTGWIAAIPYGVAVVGSIAAAASMGIGTLMNMQGMDQEDPAAILAAVGPAFGISAIVLLVIVGFLLWFVFAPSQPGTNRYGPNPKGE